ncbi:hypothetical protein RHOSPDRAFT_36829 [Rhodotorula sp. JG-1b]|nr:hypothetical protein RHOSPDRAFT_36829 [Rhodotorula sp. JG-1b]
MREQVDAALDEFRAWVVEDFPAREGWDHKASLLASARKILLMIVNIVRAKVPQVYLSGRQTCMRPDRSCSVEVALLDDLLNLDRYAHDFLERPSSCFGPERAAKMTVALVWPLNAAIAGPLASAQNLSLDDLLAGIPTYIAGYFHSYQELVKTRDVFRHMLCARLWVAQKMIAKAGNKMEAVQRLLKIKTLQDCLDLDGDDLPRSMQAISRLDKTWAVGLIAPLNEAILQTEEGKANLHVSQLVQGLPKELENKCCQLSLAQVASAREEMSRILAHNISSAARTILKITDSKTTPSFFTELVDQLAEYLLGELGTLEKVKRFDIAVTAADFESFRGSKPMGLTTYASWILDALDCVGSSLRVDHTALGQDKQMRKWCDRCHEIMELGLKQWKHLVSTGEAGVGSTAGQHPPWSRKNLFYAAPADNHNPAQDVEQQLERIDSGLGFPPHHHGDK